MKRLWLIIILLFFFTACDNQKDNIVKKPFIKVPQDEETCIAEGGKWRKIGIAPRESCEMMTGDAGKVCSSSKDCEGACIADLTASQEAEIKKGRKVKINGACSSTVFVVGCRGFVEGGAVEYMTCID